jgi:IclR family transcriptional regulator, mhp operon transcriptional activator
MPAFDPVTAVLRALEVLRLINHLEAASVAAIHRSTGYPKATVLRMVETLISAGYVARIYGTTTYAATGKCLLLGSGLRTQASMTAKATPILNAFRRKIGWPSDFALFDGDAMVIAATSREFGVLSLNRRPGARAPLLLSALGRAYPRAGLSRGSREASAIFELPRRQRLEARIPIPHAGRDTRARLLAHRQHLSRHDL